MDILYSEFRRGWIYYIRN